MNFLKYDSPIMVMLGKVFDLVCLNVLFVVLSIPLITAGAALCGLYRGCLCVYTGEGSPLKAMWGAFKSNLRFAVFICLGEAGIAGVFAALLIFGGAAGGIAALLPMMLLAVIYILQLGIVFPLLSRFENSVFATVKNALLLSLRHAPAAAAVAVLDLLPVFIYLISPELFLSLIRFWGFGIYAAIVLLQVRCLERKVFYIYTK